MNFFEILGVERKYHLTADEMERRFHERSRLVHPDKHMKADPQTRVKTALATSELNQAYRALKDPVRRAEYLLGLEGFKLSDERSGHKVPPAFLMQMLELREALGEAKDAGEVNTVRELVLAVRQRQAECSREIEAGFARYEAGELAALGAVADAMIGERYFRRFLDDAEAWEEARTEGGAGRSAAKPAGNSAGTSARKSKETA